MGGGKGKSQDENMALKSSNHGFTWLFAYQLGKEALLRHRELMVMRLFMLSQLKQCLQYTTKVV